MAIWKIIPSFPDYEASDEGGVRRAVDCGRGRFPKGMLRKQCRCPLGYLRTSLRRNGKSHDAKCHRLVVDAFIGLVPGLQINHIDGKHDNNRLENLEQVTAMENTRHSIQVLGITKCGTKNHQSKLCVSDVLEIRKRRARGETLQVICNDYSVSLGSISNVCSKKTYRDVSS